MHGKSLKPILKILEIFGNYLTLGENLKREAPEAESTPIFQYSVFAQENMAFLSILPSHSLRKMYG
jgi:hypothetical protein